MLNTARIPASLLALAMVLTVWTPAQADWRDDIDLGVHGLGYFGGNFLSEPSNKTVHEETDSRGNTLLYQGIYPGFGGTGTGGGFALDFRYVGIIGLEIGCFFTNESAKGEVNDLDLTLRHSATHVPVMLKVTAKTELVRPFAMIGWQWVFVSDAKAEFEGGGTIAAKAEDFSLFAFGLGLEIALPIDGVDLRIPLTVRGAWNTSTSEKATDRADYTTNGGTTVVTFPTQISTAFEYYAGGSLGLAWYFL
jgi:hypothetical protein